MQFKSHLPEDYGDIRDEINMRNVEFNIHWEDCDRWAWFSGEFGEWGFSTLGDLREWLEGQWERSGWAYRLVDVGEELAGRELNDIFESRRFRNDEAAINQLCKGCQSLVARINFDDKSLTFLLLAWPMRPILKKAAANELIINWWSTGNSSIRILEHMKSINDDLRAKDCQVHAVRESRASCQRHLNDEYWN